MVVCIVFCCYCGALCSLYNFSPPNGVHWVWMKYFRSLIRQPNNKLTISLDAFLFAFILVCLLLNFQWPCGGHAISSHTLWHKHLTHTHTNREKNLQSESKKNKRRDGMFNICTQKKANSKSKKKQKRNIILTNIDYKSDGVYGIKWWLGCHSLWIAFIHILLNNTPIRYSNMRIKENRRRRTGKKWPDNSEKQTTHDITIYLWMCSSSIPTHYQRDIVYNSIGHIGYNQHIKCCCYYYYRIQSRKHFFSSCQKQMQDKRIYLMAKAFRSI